MEVSKTIFKQLGGNRFAAMVGAKEFTGSENTLQFRVGRNSLSVNRVRIEYKPGSDRMT